MEAENCQESPKDFIFNISVHTKDFPKGLNVSSDQLRPCEAGHKITFSIAEPQGVQPLTLCFPYPVLVDCIEATLLADRSIQVVLKKALNEPWPYDFNLKPTWDVDKFKLWKDLNPNDNVSKLYILMSLFKRAFSD
uniref:CS domain-containing protein n=1 Tax=Daphnia galeata TaxID=27404 RepID=A0A8J2WMY2_9CRUS|nr:unnamed protein product [Daphnia galeata]